MFLHDMNGQEDLLLQSNMKMTRPCAAEKRGIPGFLRICQSLTSEKRTKIKEWKTQIGNGLTTIKLGLLREVISNTPRILADNLEF